MSKFFNKKLVDMSDNELKHAYSSLQTIHEDLLKKRQHPKFIKNFKNRPPSTINPAFVEMQNNLLNEMKKRKINHG